MNFDTNLKEVAQEEQAKFLDQVEEQGENDNNQDETFMEQFDLFCDKDQFMQILESSKEYMDNQIGGLENQINKAIQSEWTKTSGDMTLKQHKRNRSIIKEIITTCETFRTEIKDEFTTLRGEEEDA